MSIITANPDTWTNLGTGPMGLFPRSWRVRLIFSDMPPAADAEHDIVAPAGAWFECNVSTSIYAMPIVPNLAAIGIMPIDDASAGGGGIGSEPLVPVNAVLPMIEGTPSVGQSLIIDFGEWTNTPTEYWYQMLRDGQPISGVGGRSESTSTTYVVAAQDSGKALTVNVTAANSDGASAIVTSLGITIS